MAKKKIHEEHVNHERWLVSYADFITLLFAFFVVMYALGQTEQREYKDAIISIRKSFLSGGGIFPLKGFPMSPFDGEKGAPHTPQQGSQASSTRTNNGGEGSAQDLQTLNQQLKKLFERHIGLNLDANDLEVIPTPLGFRIRLAEDIVFRPGSSKIRRKNVPFLYEVGVRLRDIASNIQVEGHTDNNTPEEGKDNWQLSMDRAFNVTQFLVRGADFPADKITMGGYGGTRPISENQSPEGRARNRRVELVVTAKKAYAEPEVW